MTCSRLLRPTVAASILGMLVLAGCSSSMSTNLTTTTVANKAANPSAVPVNLRRTIFDRLPTGYIEEPNGSDLNGPLGLAATTEAVDNEETAAQEAILRQYGFRSAYQRACVVKGTAETLIIRVQVMGSPEQARSYLTVLTFDDRLSTQVAAFPTPHLADASGFTRSFTATNGSDVSQDINLARGRLLLPPHPHRTAGFGLAQRCLENRRIPEHGGRITGVHLAGPSGLADLGS
jgi:hypothetical protein